MSNTVKDITSTSFGLVIAYLIPGLAMLLAVSPWSATVSGMFRQLANAESNASLFFFVMLAALTLGLFVTLVRYLVFECILLRGQRLKPEDFSALAKDGALEAFRAAVDEHYRYHQSWGGLCVVMPVLLAAWCKEYWTGGTGVEKMSLVVLWLAIVLVLGVGAGSSYQRYVTRARAIMKGSK